MKLILRKIDHLIMKIFVILLCLFSAINISTAQVKGDYQWIGGYQINFGGVGSKGFLFDFNEYPVKILKTNPFYGIDRNNASICDQDGKILFYTNGRGVMNNQNELMPNGNDINSGTWADRYWPDPRYGYPGLQDIIILPDPGNEDGYYILIRRQSIPPPIIDSFEIRYSYVDITWITAKVI
ncbi:MAG: hypothetical protein IPO92_20260 [Saprospiraceae bacterium]|nr:hypothetical protein [Saprospiraceae bacterium]